MTNPEMGGATGSRSNWLSQTGMKMMAAAAGERGFAGKRKSKPKQDTTSGGMACCHLALPDRECKYKGDKSSYTCPSGWYRQWWFCCEGTRQAGCGECTKSTSTCWQGPFECSIWWWTGQSC